MRLTTFLRLSLLGPLLLPPLAASLPLSLVAIPGLILTVGIYYYAFGYALFAIGVLYWLSRPRSMPDVRRAVLLAPLGAAPLISASVVLVGLAFGTGRPSEALTEFFLWGAVTIGLGYAYGLAVLLLARLLALRADEPVSHAV